MGLVIYLIGILFDVLLILVIAHVFLSYFLSPYHPVRQFIDRIVDPMLAPIRRMMPATGPIDFSPMVLLIILYILEIVIRRLLIAIA